MQVIYLIYWIMKLMFDAGAIAVAIASVLSSSVGNGMCPYVNLNDRIHR